MHPLRRLFLSPYFNLAMSAIFTIYAVLAYRVQRWDWLVIDVLLIGANSALLLWRLVRQEKQ